MLVLVQSGCDFQTSSVNKVDKKSTLQIETVSEIVDVKLFEEAIKLEMDYFKVSGLDNLDHQSTINKLVFDTLKSWHTRMAAEANVVDQNLKVTRAYTDVLSFVMDYSTSPSEGIHYRHVDGFNINIKTGELIAKEELLLIDSQSVEKIEAIVNEIVDFKGFNAEKMTLDHNIIDGYFLTNDNLVLYYYEGSHMELEIPIEQMEPYLTF